MTIYQSHEIEQVISLLQGGAVGAFPTDTVYGLGARADNDQAVLRVFCVKRRPQQMALPLLLSDVSQLSLVSDEIPAAARLLAERFWPGGLTIVLPRSSRVSLRVSGGGQTVAVRVPRHQLTLHLVRGIASPLVGTSANLSGHPSPLSAADVAKQIGDDIDFVLDGGRVPGGIESTVVDVTGNRPRIVREGALAVDEISCFLRGKGIELLH